MFNFLFCFRNEELNKQVNLLRIENTRISEELNEVINVSLN